MTPAALITGVITEHGVIQQRDGGVDVNGFLREKGLLEAPAENGARWLLQLAGIVRFL